MIRFKFRGKKYWLNTEVLKSNLKAVGRKAVILLGFIVFMLVLGIVGTMDYLTQIGSDLTVWDAIKIGIQ